MNMKALLRPMLCGGLLAALLCTPSLAAEPAASYTLLVNGQEAAFPDALPVQAENELYLPAVATLEALGYDLTWDEASLTLTASREDGCDVTLTVGENQVSYSGPNWHEASEDGASASAGGSAGVLQLENAPYIDQKVGRTYMPSQVLTDALDCRVAVEDNTEYTLVEGEVTTSDGTTVTSYEPVAGTPTYTVIIDDVNTIWAANTETYELMDRYMDYARRYSEGNWRINGSLAMGVEIGEDTVDITGDYGIVTNETALELDADLAFDMGIPQGGMSVTLPDLDAALRCDVETGMLYFQSQALSASDTWYSLNMKEFYDALYGPGFYDELVALSAASVDMTFEESLKEILLSDTLPLYTGSTTQTYLNLFNAMFADSAFERSGTTYTSTPFDLTEDGVHMVMQVKLYTSGSQINGYGVEMTLSEEDVPVMSMTVTMRGNQMDMEMLFQVPEEMTMTFSLDGTYQSTSTAPATEPPAGATVVDLMETLLGTGDTILAPEPEPVPAA